MAPTAVTMPPIATNFAVTVKADNAAPAVAAAPTACAPKDTPHVHTATTADTTTTAVTAIAIHIPPSVLPYHLILLE